MARIGDVARHAGVSPATASRALSGRGYVSEATRLRVERAARELGYTPSAAAASLVTGRTMSVGVLTPTLDRWFFTEVLGGIQDALLARRYDLVLYIAAHDSPAQETVLAALRARRHIDGLIAIGIEPGTPEREGLAALGIPIVSIGGDSEEDAVSIDDYSAGRIVTEHLLTLGHREIAFLGGAGGAASSYADGQRLEGYRTAMSDAGYADAAAHVRCAASLPGGYAAAVDLLRDRRARPTALVGVCDEVAIGAIIASRRMGLRVPDNLSIVGIDDHRYASMFSLTTLRQHPRLQGEAAVSLLLRQLSNGNDHTPRLVEASALVVRASTIALDDASSAIVRPEALRPD